VCVVVVCVCGGAGGVGNVCVWEGVCGGGVAGSCVVWAVRHAVVWHVCACARQTVCVRCARQCVGAGGVGVPASSGRPCLRAVGGGGSVGGVWVARWSRKQEVCVCVVAGEGCSVW